MKEKVFLFSDFAMHHEDISFILDGAPKDLSRIHTDLEFLYKGLIKTDGALSWNRENTHHLIQDFRRNFPNPYIIGLFLDKGITDYDDENPSYQNVFYERPERTFVVPCRLGFKTKNIQEECYPDMMYVFGLVKGLKPHNRPGCFLHNPHYPTDVKPQSFCRGCSSRAKAIDGRIYATI